MIYRLGRHIRPLVCRLNQIQTQRCMSSRRNVPIAWRPRSLLSDAFSRDPWRDFRDMERNFEDMWRGIDRMMGPRYFDTYYIRPRDAESRTEVSKLKYDSEGFELKLDVQDFAPDELKVKMAGNKLTISGKHEQKADEHGFVSREFHRELTIPEDVNLETMTSSISEEGVLTIRAEIIEKEKPAEKVIDIQKETKEKTEQNSD